MRSQRKRRLKRLETVALLPKAICIAATGGLGHGLGERGTVDRNGEEYLGGKGLGGSKDRGGTRNRRGHGILPGTANNDRIPSSPLPSPLQELRPVVHAARWPFGLDGEARAFVCLPGTITGTPAFGVVVGKQDQRLDI